MQLKEFFIYVVGFLHNRAPMVDLSHRTYWKEMNLTAAPFTTHAYFPTLMI